MRFIPRHLISMKIRIQIVLSLIGCLCYGQKQNTKNLFYNLPIDSSSTVIHKLLLADTINFKTKMVGTWRRNAHTQIPYFYPKINNGFFYPEPISVYVKIDSLRKVTDTNLTIALMLAVNFGKNIKRKEAHDLYVRIVEGVKTEYDSIGYGYIKGSVSQTVEKSGREKESKWTVYEHSTYFFDKTDSNKAKLSIDWFDERKHGQSIFLHYKLK